MHNYLSLIYFIGLLMLLFLFGLLVRKLEEYCKKKSVYDIIEDDSVSSDDSVILDIYETCPICLSALIKDVVITNCNHKFHNKCLKRLGKSDLPNKCPVCREKITKLTKINP